MSEQERKADELEQLLRDERALRLRAEVRAAEQTEKTQTWRSRAEERAERIKRLESERKRPRRRKRAAVTTPRPDPAPPATPVTSSATNPTRLASVRAAIALQPQDQLTVNAFATDEIGGSRLALAEADLVIVDPVAIESLAAAERVQFDEWLDTPARQPLVVITAGGSNPGLAQRADVVYAASAAALAALRDRGIEALALPPVFDPTVDNPAGRSLQTFSVVSRETTQGIPVLMADGALVGIETTPDQLPPPWLVAAAASGIPLAGTKLDHRDGTQLAKASVAARRWAYRNHTPMTRAAQIAATAGISIPDPRPSAAAVLVSMRPEQACEALEMVRNQTYRPLAAVVGIHGTTPTKTLQQLIDEMEAELPITLLTFSPDLTLGECLNRAIESTAAEILIKIDDDDFYGPSHIEDGIHALEYSQAGIVGKGAQFTYVEEQDTTVLRRAREEETFIGGSPTGATMLIRRSTWEPIGFPHRPRQVDVLFTRSARLNGATVYANSRWDFCYIRQKEGHTWKTTTSTFLTGADPQWSGFHPDRTIVPSLPDPVIE